MRLLSTLVVLLCIGAGIVFGALNQDLITIDLWFASVRTAVGVSLLLTLLLGALLGGIVIAASVVWPLRRRMNRLRRELSASVPASTAAGIEPVQPPAAAP